MEEQEGDNEEKEVKKIVTKKNNKERYVYEDVVTETGRALKDLETGKQLTQEEINIKILNDLDVIKRSVA